MDFFDHSSSGALTRPIVPLRMLTGNMATELEVNGVWSWPKLDGKLNISSSTYSCGGVALSFKEVIWVSRCTETILGSRMWVNIYISHSQFTQSTSRWNLMIWFKDYSCGLSVRHVDCCHVDFLVLDRDQDANFWKEYFLDLLPVSNMTVLNTSGTLRLPLSLPHTVLSFGLVGIWTTSHIVGSDMDSDMNAFSVSSFITTAPRITSPTNC